MLDALQSVPIWYRGSNSQKLDVWRTFDFSLEKPGGSGTMSKACYRSSKGFVIDKSKFFGYCLKPGTTHYDHFAGVGYTMDNADQLFLDIEAHYDVTEIIDVRPSDDRREKFSIPMKLGITDKRLFRTVWMYDAYTNETKFITAYIDSSLKEDRRGF